MEENKEILELLTKIEKHSRRQTFLCTLLCACAVITALCCIVTFASVNHLLAQVEEVMPQITGAIPQITGVIAQMDSVLANLDAATKQLAVMDLTGMVEDVNDLVITGQQTLEQTMQKLNGIDFDALNKGIRDLSAVIEPLAKVSTLFR